MRRRDFIKVIAGSPAVWPLSARAQQADRVRVIGATTSLSENDPKDKASSAAFRQSLQELGWTVGGNVRIKYRYGAGRGDPRPGRDHCRAHNTSPAYQGGWGE